MFFISKNEKILFMEKKLTRSKNKIITGVCAGIADYFDLDPTIVRLGYVLLSIFTAVLPGVVFYIIASIVMPMEN